MEGAAAKYLVRDPQGNVYGPADDQMLRDWVQQGRIVPGMGIAAEGTAEWVEASVHPVVADLLLTRVREVGGAAAVGQVGAVPTAEKEKPTGVAAALELEKRRKEEVLRRAAERIGVAPEVLLEARPGQVEDYAPPPEQNKLGIVSFVLGVSAVVLPCCLFCVAIPVSGVLGAAAITLGTVALVQFQRNPGKYTERGYAIAGVITGVVAELIVIGLIIYTIISMTHP